MEILHKPCEPKEAIYFDQGNLTRFLEYLDQTQFKSQSDLNQIKVKLRVLDYMEQQIKDLIGRVESQNIRILNNEASISNHNERIGENEAKGQIHYELINKNQEEIKNINQNIKTIDEKIVKIENNICVNTNSISLLRENFNNLKNVSDNHKNTLEKHDSNLHKLNEDFLKIPELEGNLINHKDKTKEKFKKSKRRFMNYVSQMTSNWNAIENYIKGNNTDPKFNDKSFEFPSFKLNEFDNNNSSSNIDNNALGKKKEISDQIKSLKKTIDLHDQQIIKLNNIVNTDPLTNFNKQNFSLNNQSDDNHVLDLNKQLKELNDKFLDFENLNKHILRHLDLKVSRDDLDNSNKQIIMQFERMDQRNRRMSKINMNESINAISKAVDSDLSISPEIKEAIKRLVLETLKGSDIIEKIILNQNNTEEDILKINDYIKAIDNELSNHSEQFKAIPKIHSKLSEFEDIIRDINRSINELNSREMIEEFRSNALSYPPKMITVRESIKLLVKYLKENEQYLNNVNNKLENINQEIIQKVKKDLANESSKLIDEFKMDLKCSITRVQDQLKDKVDMFNLDEFSKKLDMRILHEVSKKLDRNDLNKNTTVINKKIDSLENKISKTLVDALIDLQLEEAPLIMKKSLQGSDKCGSCNQHLPFSCSNNLINQYNHMNMNHQQQEKAEKTVNFGTTQNIKRSLHKAALESSDESIPGGKNKFNASSKNFNLPELAHSSSFSKSINKYNKPISKESSQKPTNIKKVNASSQLNLSQPLMNYDEISEKHLNSMLNSELEKKIIKPENIIRATKRVYENIDKKYKEK